MDPRIEEVNECVFNVVIGSLKIYDTLDGIVDHEETRLNVSATFDTAFRALMMLGLNRESAISAIHQMSVKALAEHKLMKMDEKDMTDSWFAIVQARYKK